MNKIGHVIQKMYGLTQRWLFHLIPHIIGNVNTVYTVENAQTQVRMLLNRNK